MTSNLNLATNNFLPDQRPPLRLISDNCPDLGFELSLLNALIAESQISDVTARMSNEVFPAEAASYFCALWQETTILDGETIWIGKIIVNEIMQFESANPKLGGTEAIGASVGALTLLAPSLAPMLAPLASLIGHGAGARLNRSEQTYDGIVAISEDSFVIAKRFYEVFASIINELST